MWRASLVAGVAILLVALGSAPDLSAQASDVSTELLPNGTLVILGSEGDDLIVAEAAEPNTVAVQAGQSETWTFVADQVTAIKVETFEGDDRVFVRSTLPSWTLTSVNVDLGEGANDAVAIGVYSPAGGSHALAVTGNVATRGGAAKLSAGSEIGESRFSVGGNVIQIGGPGGDSLGVETEFETGVVTVAGDVRLMGGDGPDYAELNANGEIDIAGTFMVHGQAGEDYVWLGGRHGGRVEGVSRFFGGPGFDTLEFEAFDGETISIKQFEDCIECPGLVVPASITVEAYADPADGTVFPFTVIAPDAGSWTFSLSDTDGEGGSWSLDGILNFGPYSVEEQIPAEWQLDGIVCYDSFYGEDPTIVYGNPVLIQVHEASDITCSFTNSAS